MSGDGVKVVVSKVRQNSWMNLETVLGWMITTSDLLQLSLKKLSSISSQWVGGEGGLVDLAAMFS